MKPEPQHWNRMRVTVMGLGRFGGGLGVTRWLAHQGARVTVTDTACESELMDSLAQLADLDVRLRLGGHHDADFENTDLVVVNPAISDESPFLAAARAARVPITTEINLFVERCRARTVGITGSVGKSTTTAMLGHVLERVFDHGRTWVGGNLGRSLLSALPEISADDIVVLELSSFQLHRTPLARWSPHVALITNIAPNHLDWHGTFAAYAAAKLNIVRYQDPEHDSIVIADTAELREPFMHLFGDLAGIWRFSRDDGGPSARRQSSSAIESDDQFVRWDALALSVPGAHNEANATAALTAAHALGVDSAAAREALRGFQGLPDRLECVGSFNGVQYYNDSKATTPEAAVTAMRSFEAPLLVILGGYDKGLDLTPAAREAVKRARFAACVGQTGAMLHDAIIGGGGATERFASFDEGVHACLERACEGDVVLLSPGCASWDQFSEYRQRGQRFKDMVRAFVETSA